MESTVTLIHRGKGGSGRGQLNVSNLATLLWSRDLSHPSPVLALTLYCVLPLFPMLGRGMGRENEASFSITLTHPSC